MTIGGFNWSALETCYRVCSWVFGCSCWLLLNDFGYVSPTSGWKILKRRHERVNFSVIIDGFAIFKQMMFLWVLLDHLYSSCQFFSGSKWCQNLCIIMIIYARVQSCPILPFFRPYYKLFSCHCYRWGTFVSWMLYLWRNFSGSNWCFEMILFMIWNTVSFDLHVTNYFVSILISIILLVFLYCFYALSNLFQLRKQVEIRCEAEAFLLCYWSISTSIDIWTCF